MKLKSIMIISSLVSSVMITNNAISAEGIDYSNIINKFKQDAAQDKCLRTFRDNNLVSIGDCTAKGGSSDYDSMRKGQVVEQSNGLFLIKNKYKKDVNGGECLRTIERLNEIEVGNCNAQGGSSDYTSMRQWAIIENDNNYALLQNKYKQDAGEPSCIRIFSDNNSVLIGTCNPQGGSSDFTSMRQWISDAFPFEKPWSPTGLVSIPYTIPEASKAGFDSVTFPMNIEESPEERGYYYAMQYRLINGNLGYIGLQPRDKNSGLAIFSVFGSGAKPIAAHCRGGADGGDGVSCSKEINLVFGHKYNLTVKRDDENNKVWRGYIKDTVTGEIDEIGAWQPRDGSEGISSSNTGFVEYYSYINSCSKIPATKVFFGDPIANSDVKGVINKPNSYGKCKELIEYGDVEKADGWDVGVKGKK